MSDNIAAALTPEEWADPDHKADSDGFWVYMPGGMDMPVVGAADKGIGVVDGIRHATAALCLYEQPFGFTRADVEALRDVITSDYCLANDTAALKSLRDRIAALLPPA